MVCCAYLIHICRYVRNVLTQSMEKKIDEINQATNAWNGKECLAAEQILKL